MPSPAMRSTVLLRTETSAPLSDSACVRVAHRGSVDQHAGRSRAGHWARRDPAPVAASGTGGAAVVVGVPADRVVADRRERDAIGHGPADDQRPLDDDARAANALDDGSGLDRQRDVRSDRHGAVEHVDGSVRARPSRARAERPAFMLSARGRARSDGGRRRRRVVGLRIVREERVAVDLTGCDGRVVEARPGLHHLRHRGARGRAARRDAARRAPDRYAREVSVRRIRPAEVNGAIGGASL